ncbi:MAG TPA: TonB-dependent receptor [Kiloniellales bacterium]|nr:TonB-dependent receptor [Kiloniellales bacterium]
MRRIARGILAASVVVALGGLEAARAQNIVSGQNIVVTSPITVTATTNPLEAFEYPGSVTVIGEDEIETKIPSTVDDIVEDVPNVTFAGGPRRTGEVPIIRGFTGQDVIVLLDGTRQNFISGHDGRFFVDPALLDQVEVVRGATSALYGSGGLGGTIEFRTKDAADFLLPGETYGANVFLGYQSANDEFAPGITLFATPMEGLDLIGSFVYRTSGDIRLGGGEELDADDDILSGLFKASYQFDDSNVEFGWTRYDGSALEPNNGQGTEGPDNENVDKDLLAETFRLTYAYSDPNNDWVDLNAQVYYTRYQADEQRLVTSGLGPAGELLTRDLNTIGFRLDNRSRFAIGDETNVILTYGAEAYRDKQEGKAGDADREGVPNAQSTFYGFFAQAEISTPAPLGLPGSFLIIPGVRYDNYSSSSDIADDNNDDAVSPKLGVSYLPTEWMMAYVSYAHAFSAPNLNDLYATGVHFEIPGFGTNFFVPNPDLKPQTTRTFEAGLGFEFDNVFWLNDRFAAKGGYFRTWAKDLISFDVFQPVPPACFPPNCNGTTTVRNISDAMLDGIEATAAYENEFFLIEVSYGHINGVDRATGERIGGLQPDQLALNVAGKLPEIDAVVGWRVIGAGDFADLESTTDTDESRDAYVVQDVYAIWQPDDELLNGLSVAVGIDNITDEEYTRVFTGANEVGRNFKALVSYTLAW